MGNLEKPIFGYQPDKDVFVIAELDEAGKFKKAAHFIGEHGFGTSGYEEDVNQWSMKSLYTMISPKNPVFQTVLDNKLKRLVAQSNLLTDKTFAIIKHFYQEEEGLPTPEKYMYYIKLNEEYDTSTVHIYKVIIILQLCYRTKQWGAHQWKCIASRSDQYFFEGKKFALLEPGEEKSAKEDRYVRFQFREVHPSLAPNHPRAVDDDVPAKKMKMMYQAEQTGRRHLQFELYDRVRKQIKVDIKYALQDPAHEMKQQQLNLTKFFYQQLHRDENQKSYKWCIPPIFAPAHLAKIFPKLNTHEAPDFSFKKSGYLYVFLNLPNYVTLRHYFSSKKIWNLKVTFVRMNDGPDIDGLFPIAAEKILTRSNQEQFSTSQNVPVCGVDGIPLATEIDNRNHCDYCLYMIVYSHKGVFEDNCSKIDCS